MFKVIISAMRQKLALVKMVRSFTGMGLKESKDFIEKNVDFDGWLDPRVEIHLILTDYQLGRFCHWQWDNTLDCSIESIEETVPPVINPWDFVS